MKKVLIVEDHADIRRLIRMTLEFEDCEVFEAATGATGLEVANSVIPDLILLDVMMPGELDGLEVCRRVKRDPASRAKVLMLSARGMDSDRQLGADAGADAYLVKPFSPLQLIQVIDELFAPARQASA